MSIILKGIDLPKDEVITFHYLNERGEMVIKIIDKNDAIQIDRPHGRLIDADDLETDTEWSEYLDGFMSYSWMEIQEAPTILEAEEE